MLFWNLPCALHAVVTTKLWTGGNLPFDLRSIRSAVMHNLVSGLLNDMLVWSVDDLFCPSSFFNRLKLLSAWRPLSENLRPTEAPAVCARLFASEGVCELVRAVLHEAVCGNGARCVAVLLSYTAYQNLRKPISNVDLVVAEQAILRTSDRSLFPSPCIRWLW